MANKYSWEENQINLLNRMLGDVPATIEKREGSFVYDTLSPVANEISKFYLRLDETYVRMFIQTSYAAYLDARALEFGLIRLNGDLAKGILNFTGSDGTEIHLGSVFQTKDGLQFVTTNTNFPVASSLFTVTLLPFSAFINRFPSESVYISFPALSHNE